MRPGRYMQDIDDNFLYSYLEKDFDEITEGKYDSTLGRIVYKSNSSKASYMFLRRLHALHKQYGVASKVSSERVKVPEEHSAVLKKMRIQFIRDDPGVYTDDQKVPFYERKEREMVDRNVGKDMRRKLKVCWLYEDETQVCLSF